MIDAKLPKHKHKRFVPYGTHPNSSLMLRTSFMPGTLHAILPKPLKKEKKKHDQTTRKIKSK